MYVYVIYISVQNFTLKFQAAAEKTAKNSRGGGTFLCHTLYTNHSL